MARYSIMIRENGNPYETLLATVETNPLAVVKAARARTRRVTTSFDGKRVLHELPRYDHVVAIDNDTGERLP